MYRKRINLCHYNLLLIVSKIGFTYVSQEVLMVMNSDSGRLGLRCYHLSVTAPSLSPLFLGPQFELFYCAPAQRHAIYPRPRWRSIGWGLVWIWSEFSRFTLRQEKCQNTSVLYPPTFLYPRCQKDHGENKNWLICDRTRSGPNRPAAGIGGGDFSERSNHWDIWLMSSLTED